MKKYSDEDLLLRLQNPNTQRKAFEDLVNQYSSSLYWQIRHIVTYHDDADDVLQNTFIRAWKHLSGFRGESSLNTWLSRIAVNESLTFLQQQKPGISLDDPESQSVHEISGDPYFDGNHTAELLKEAIETLPPKQRTVFSLRYFEELPYEEMSKLLGTTTGALKASYHHAVEKIQQYFDTHD